MVDIHDQRWTIRDPSEGDVIDRNTRKIAYTLRNERGTQLQNEKMMEIDLEDDKPVDNNDQFGIGGKRRAVISQP
jgi:hypothetical protein